MANTVIALKKSATPSAVPTNLANGELAINFADGKLFYKAANGNIVEYASADGINFGTVNANGTLIVSDINNDVFSLVPGTAIAITGDAINDTITISANLAPALEIANAAYIQANTARDHANAAYDEANTASLEADTATQISLLAYLQANTARDHANISYNQANTARTHANGAYLQANTARDHANLAFNKANNALANTTGTFEGTLTIKDDLIVTGNVTVDANTLYVDATNNRVGIRTTAPAYSLEVVGTFAATTKSFVITHPSKKGMKLRYGSLEGPENGVYVRGRVTDQNYIELPDYWAKLIHLDSITVSLTPIGKTQQPSVGKITKNRINLIGNDIDCFYHVFAERKDVEKLIVEF